MSVRATMSDLITRVSLMIADPSNATITQQEVQDKLDECRHDVFHELLSWELTFATTGMTYNDYYFKISGDRRTKAKGFWEANEVLINGSFATLSPTTSDELVGHWTFAVSQPPPVFITGRRYDIYRAAADLLDYKIANLAATTFDFTSDGQSFKVSQQLMYLEKMRTDYRGKQEARTYQTHRLDADADTSAMPGFSSRQLDLAGAVSQYVPFLTGE